ncbi:transporter substrate-binding domain-containing protein [Subtercola frigoramans]|uniref:Polar amino acid transport system substrate-binding protein n=1 Tax=Subtercola frigoramans TaxID=120298 RepID=A0ABS2L183_9MICO|nr:transporter substrate-binding domain-containing protein [Subtercola frigoramans]MBM7470706.1 polar amino acid transport system substrate-binding protein [Subtercola frigoramans]
MPIRHSVAVTAVSLVAVASLLTACSSSGTSTASSSSTAPTTLTVGMSWPYEPWQVGDGTDTTKGIEPELLAAIGAKAGYTMDIQNVDFTGIITGTQAGKYDLAVSGLGIYGERLKALNFIPDAKTGYTMLIDAADKATYATLTDLCGVPTAVGSGTKSATDVEVANGTKDNDGSSYAGACKDNPIQATVFDDQAGQDLALQTGKVKAELLTQQVAQGLADKSSGKYVVAEPYSFVNFGIGMTKTNTELGDKLVTAFKAVIADGTYAQILAKYGQESAALTESDIVLQTK